MIIKIGLGVLRLPPNAFWDMTLKELLLAHEGFNEANGVKSKEDEQPSIDGDTLHEMLKNG